MLINGALSTLRRVDLDRISASYCNINCIAMYNMLSYIQVVGKYLYIDKLTFFLEHAL